MVVQLIRSLPSVEHHQRASSHHVPMSDAMMENCEDKGADSFHPSRDPGWRVYSSSPHTGTLMKKRQDNFLKVSLITWFS